MEELDKLLINLADKQTDEIEAIGRKRYNELCDVSHQTETITTHDGYRVMFYRDRFEHAFFTSSNWAQYPDQKDKLDADRIARIEWICEFISGRVPGVECWEVERLDGRLFPKMRVYLTWDPAYIVWLDELRGGFRFKYSSGYPTVPKRLRGYCHKGRLIWPLPPTKKNAP